MLKNKNKMLKIISAVLTVVLLISCALVANAEDEKVLELRLTDDHPGIPGFDLVLQFSALYGELGNMDRIDDNSFTLTCDVEEAIIDGNKLTLPAKFKDTTDLEGFNVYATYNDNPDVSASYPVVLKKWSLVLEDNFDGTELNPEYWYVNSTTGKGTHVGEEKYMAQHKDAVTVENGNMVMRVLKNNDKKRSEADFLTAGVGSNFTQNEGLFLTKMKMPTRGGCNTAFWTMPSSGAWGQTFFVSGRSGKNEGYFDGEFDIVEYSPNWKKAGVPYFECTDHWWNSDFVRRTPGSNKVFVYDKLATDYITFALAWTPTALYYYCDGQLVKTVKNIENTGEKAVIRYSVGEGSYNGSIYKWAGAFTDADLEYMVAYVDYFKMYK